MGVGERKRRGRRSYPRRSKNEIDLIIAFFFDFYFLSMEIMKVSVTSLARIYWLLEVD